MTSDPTIKLRVDRLQNDTESIDELVADFRADFGDFRTGVDEFRTGVDEFRTEFNDFRTGVNEFRTETRGRFDRIESTLSEVLHRLPDPT